VENDCALQLAHGSTSFHNSGENLAAPCRSSETSGARFDQYALDRPARA